MRSYRLLLLPFCLLIIFAGNKGLASDDPQFGKIEYVLGLPNQTIRQPSLSPNGNFIFANLDLRDVEGGTTYVKGVSQAFWDLRDAPPTEKATVIEPTQILSLNNGARVAAEFSADERYLAVKTDTELQLRRLPDLNIYEAIPAVSRLDDNYSIFYNYLKWSLTGQLVGTLADNNIMVWDVEQDKIMKYPIKYQLAAIVPVQNGWVIQSFDYALDKENNNQFAFCTLYLEKCDFYTHLDYRGAIIAPDGQTIITNRSLVEGAFIVDGFIGIWKRDENNLFSLTSEYNFEEVPFSKQHPLCALSFSPDSQNIVSNCSFRVDIWNADFSNVFSSFENVRYLAWIPDRDYFVTLDGEMPPTFHIYQVGIEQPIDTLGLSDFPEIANLPGLLSGVGGSDEKLVFSEDGNTLVYNSGEVALVIALA